MTKLGKIVSSMLLIVALIIGVAFFMYTSSLKAVDTSNNDEVIFEIAEGSFLNNILVDLEEQELIKSSFAAKIYTKLNPVPSIKFGTYKLSKSMSLKEILDTFNSGSSFNPNEITVTFIEGLNLKQYQTIIDNNFSMTGEDFMNEVSSEEFLKPLIEDYWFLTDEILAEGIFFPLEGYLSPNTYSFTSKDATSLEIVSTMLEQMESILDPFKDTYQNDQVDSIHQLLTLASIVELEAVTDEDRQGVAGVFINRLEDNTYLGSDVTTYYGVGVLMSERDLYQYEIDDQNPYNTRNSVVGLPIGPVSNPSKSSIEASINYTDDDSYFFVSDKNRNIHFTKTYQEHLKIIAKLKEEGLWFVW